MSAARPLPPSSSVPSPPTADAASWVTRLLTDNAKSYTVARVFLRAAETADVRLLHTRPYRPQTNGKAERFIRILQDEWAYARCYRSNEARLRQLPRWLFRCNYRRPHGGIGGVVPASRL